MNVRDKDAKKKVGGVNAKMTKTWGPLLQLKYDAVNKNCRMILIHP